MVAKPDDLLALADRCEREEPTVKLRHDIAKALGWTWVQFGYVQWRNPSGRDASVPNWCESLDAAVTLVPEGWSISVGCSETRKHAQVQLGRSYPTNKVVTLEGRTMALALCAAALRARAALLTDMDK